LGFLPLGPVSRELRRRALVLPQVQQLWYCVPMSRRKPNPQKTLLHDKIRSIADALYSYEEGSSWTAGDLHALAALASAVAEEAETELQQLKRTLGGLNSKVGTLYVTIEKLREDVKEYPAEMAVLTDALDEEQARNRQLADQLAVAELRLLRVKK